MGRLGGLPGGRCMVAARTGWPDRAVGLCIAMSSPWSGLFSLCFGGRQAAFMMRCGGRDRAGAVPSCRWTAAGEL